ncbi:MAG: histidine triad nucleotide-binding protein [Sulfuricurvum sp.]|uniref:histidine triad nucleotide-binding protein n=1 Tax=Sulfuricurvum sp. TaxID=2025608 RepID=UPI00262CCCDE|nr:histidine triad nucleotide-binding protein [Sulfuricurvum sp.]MDD2828813.1 histidine triad nucleotide-binding protein [Sulfuricurvum sp.]MDD4948728.1 histidine triad nucleotide-binding protein [Sulfuricurvum sp.]
MCIFCKIINREIPSNLVKEDENFFAFHDINPKAPVHVLVIPKTHYNSFNDIPEGLMGKMGSFMQEVARELGIDQSGYRIISNIGENGGQEVGHLHFHILGGAKLKWGHFADADPKDFF